MKVHDAVCLKNTSFIQRAALETLGFAGGFLPGQKCIITADTTLRQ
jgi:hypothetical protein